MVTRAFSDEREKVIHCFVLAVSRLKLFPLYGHRAHGFSDKLSFMHLSTLYRPATHDCTLRQPHAPGYRGKGFGAAVQKA